MNELHKKFGELLRLERERRGQKLENLAGELKISEENLTSIESGDAAGLPSELYYKLFSKSYAEYLGIDYAKTIEAIAEDIGDPVEPAANDRKGRDGKETAGPKKRAKKTDETEDEVPEEAGDAGFVKKAITFAIVIIVVFAALLGAYKLFFEGDTAGLGVDPDGEGVGDGAADLSSEVINRQYASYEWPEESYSGPDSLVLTVTAGESSWATILADGDTVIYKNLTPGREYTVRAQYRLLVSIGIPRVVSTRLNGQEVVLTRSASGRISRVEINQVNKDSFTATSPQRPERRAPVAEQPTASPARDVAPDTGAASDSL